MMFEYLPMECFKAIYVVDLCHSLCEVRAWVGTQVGVEPLITACCLPAVAQGLQVCNICLLHH